MSNLYANAYEFIPWVMILSGIVSAALLERMTIMGRPRVYVVGIWMACAACTMIGIGLVTGTRGTLLGEIVLGLGDTFLAGSLPFMAVGYWWQTRREFADRRADYFGKSKSGGAK